MLKLDVNLVSRAWSSFRALYFWVKAKPPASTRPERAGTGKRNTKQSRIQTTSICKRRKTAMKHGPAR